MNTKTAYQFDTAGLFIGETEADESPLEPGTFHLPKRCTFTAPPQDMPDDQWPRWNGAGWALTNRPAPVSEPTAVAKLADFLAANPDVANLLNGAEMPGAPSVEGATADDASQLAN